MAITLEGGFPVTFAQGSTTLGITQSITVGAGANRVLVVMATFEATGDTFSAITYNGAGLTQLASATSGGSFARAECWRSVAPTTTTANVVCTKSGSGGRCGIAIYAFDGGHQSTPTRAATTAGTASATGTTDILPSFVSGDYTLDILSIDSTGHAPAVVGGNMTADYTAQNDGAGTNEWISAHNTTDGTMGWTWTTAKPWAHLVTAVIPAAAATPNPPPIMVVDTAVARASNW